MIKKVVIFLKEHLVISIWSILLLSLWIYSKDSSFVIILLYIYIIMFLLSNILKRKVKKYISLFIWVLVTLLFSIGLYVNNYIPHGISYPTGDIICRNDDRGPCEEVYREDMTNLNIPYWAKFLRSHGFLLLLGLIFAGIILNNSERLELKKD